MIKRVYTMVINITDICNMQCAFCMRGDSGKRKLNLSLLPKIFDGIDVIDNLTITGGEPSCYVEAVTAIVDYIIEKQNDITVKGLYIVTNGKEYKQELVDAVKKILFLYIKKRSGKTTKISDKQASMLGQELKEMLYTSGVAVSMDKYHEPISLENYMKYRLSGVYSEDHEIDFSKGDIRVLARGNGAGIYRSYEKPLDKFIVEEEEGELIAYDAYITVEGKVFADCDMSYEMETDNEPVGDLNTEYLADIMDRYQKMTSS